MFDRLRLPRMSLILGLTALLSIGCEQGSAPVRGFVLPPGDADRGEQVFLARGCTTCHTVAGSELQQPEGSSLSVPLGGKFLQAKHYGDLMTSIVNPEHRVLPPYDSQVGDSGSAASPMPDFRKDLTVEQLIDVVEFLHGKYEKLPEYTGRYFYYPG